MALLPKANTACRTLGWQPHASSRVKQSIDITQRPWTTPKLFLKSGLAHRKLVRQHEPVPDGKLQICVESHFSLPQSPNFSQPTTFWIPWPIPTRGYARSK